MSNRKLLEGEHIMSSNARIFRTRNGGMRCPYCGDTKRTKFIELVYGGLMSRWKCGICGGEWRYDERPPIGPQLLKNDKRARELDNPYNSFSRGIDKDKMYTLTKNRR